MVDASEAYVKNASPQIGETSPQTHVTFEQRPLVINGVYALGVGDHASRVESSLSCF